MSDPRVLLLTVERAAERRQRSVAQLQAAGVGFEIVDGIDGLTSRPLPRTGAWRLKNTELACYYTHCRALRRLLDYDWAHAVILEDDFQLLPGAGKLRDALQDLPADCDWLALHRHRFGPVKGETLAANPRFFRLQQTCHTTVGYAVSRRLAENVLARHPVCAQPIDHLFCSISKGAGFHFYELSQPIVTVSGLPSVIHSTLPATMNGQDLLSLEGEPLAAKLYELLKPRLEAGYQEWRWRHRVIGNKERLRIHGSAFVNDALLNVHSGSITIGEQTFFGNDVALHAGTHDPDARMAARRRFPGEGCDIVIGKGVWIASRALVLGPCTIGDHAVIAAGAVVTGNVPANELWAGVPARRQRAILPEPPR